MAAAGAPLRFIRNGWAPRQQDHQHLWGLRPRSRTWGHIRSEGLRTRGQSFRRRRRPRRRPDGSVRRVACNAEINPSGSTPVSHPELTVAGLFAGIGGIELGLHAGGHRSILLCEIDPAARAVLDAAVPGPSLRARRPRAAGAARGRRLRRRLPVPGPEPGGPNRRHRGLAVEPRRARVPACWTTRSAATPTPAGCCSRTSPSCSSSTAARRCATWSTSWNGATTAGPTASSTRARSASLSAASACSCSPRGPRTRARSCSSRRRASRSRTNRRRCVRLLLDRGHQRARMGRRRGADAQGRLGARHTIAARDLDPLRASNRHARASRTPSGSRASNAAGPRRPSRSAAAGGAHAGNWSGTPSASRSLPGSENASVPPFPGTATVARCFRQGIAGRVPLGAKPAPRTPSNSRLSRSVSRSRICSTS